MKLIESKRIIYSVILPFLFFSCLQNSRAFTREKSFTENGHNKHSESLFLVSDFCQLADNLNLSQTKLGKFIPLTGNLDQMRPFLKSLKESKNRKIRIAHFGDSLLMGDVITEYLRNNLQENFSGRGIGYLSITPDDYRMKRTILQSFSDDWTNYSFITRNPQQLKFGISGTLAIPKPGSWVKFETTQVFRSLSSFDIIRVFYCNADKNSVIQYSIDDKTPVKTNLEPGDDVKELTIKTKSSSKFYLQFVSGAAPNFYGVSLESNDGIYVDNFSMRGNSGASLQELAPKTLQEFNKLLSYDLIIFNYGANVSSPNKGVYSVYENKMVAIIEDFKKTFSNTSFLLVSAADKTVKKGTQFVTNSDIPLLLEAQKRIAERTNIAFWNLWEAMGGSNSMNDWVNAAPPMALKDYSHFTFQGGERVGELFYNALIEASKVIK